jgi:hypothetical protein
MGSGSTEMFEAAAAGERIPRGVVVAAILRVVAVVAGVLVVYFLIPVEGAEVLTGLLACVGIVVILVVFARQISRVSRSRRPVLAAVEALVLVFGLFLSLFSLLYVSLSTNDPDTFTQGVDKIAGIYFTTTVLTTVGFGDISPVSDAARATVTLQMLLGMVLIGTAFKALGFSAKRAVTSHSTSVGSQGFAAEMIEDKAPYTGDALPGGSATSG